MPGAGSEPLPWAAPGSSLVAPLGLMIHRHAEEPGMPQSLARVLVHLIFSTKNRESWIAEDMRGDLHAYLGGVLDALGCPPIQVGGTADHVHILYALARTLTLANVTEQVKTSSSKWMKQRAVRAFGWQTGYGAFSVSEANLRSVARYIEQQEAHHAHTSFQDEMRDFLGRSHLQYDERYVWD